MVVAATHCYLAIGAALCLLSLNPVHIFKQSLYQIHILFECIICLLLRPRSIQGAKEEAERSDLELKSGHKKEKKMDAYRA